MEVKVTLQIRHDTAANWALKNPILLNGEYGIESNTLYIKIGDGVHHWNQLPYLNKLNVQYFTYQNDGTITFSDEFLETIANLELVAGQAITELKVTEPPVEDVDVPNKKYVDDLFNSLEGSLGYEIVSQLPQIAEAEENKLYLIEENGYYSSYILDNNEWCLIGGNMYELPVATSQTLGGVKASNADDSINVDQTGLMSINRVSTKKLYVPAGETLVIGGGGA